MRAGTRSRVGRSYRIRHHRHGGHHHGHHHGHHRHGSHFGFYFAWNTHAYPYYYRVYPRYGLYFGYGVSWYGPAYETVFVDATPYYADEVIVSEEIIEEAPYGGVTVEEPQVVEEGQPLPPPTVVEDGEAFPAPADQGATEAPAPDADDARAPHADFGPAVEAFLAGRYDDALTRLDRVLVAEPDNGEAWLAAMHANFALGHYDRAATALGKAAALDAFPRGYRFDPRPLYEKAGGFDPHVEALDAHIAKHGDDADALLVRAYLHVALSERRAAQDTLQRVLTVRPDDSTAPALALALLPAPPPPAQPTDK